MPVLNEEANLEACIASFAEICDEIIVVDSGSTDRTVEIARRFTDRVFVRPVGGLPDLPQVRDAARALPLAA